MFAFKFSLQHVSNLSAVGTPFGQCHATLRHDVTSLMDHLASLLNKITTRQKVINIQVLLKLNDGPGNREQGGVMLNSRIKQKWTGAITEWYPSKPHHLPLTITIP